MADQEDVRTSENAEICNTCGRDVIFKQEDGDFCGICKQKVTVVPKKDDGPYGC